MEARAVAETRVDPRAGIVEAAPGLGGEPLRQAAHGLLVGEPHGGPLETAPAIEVDLVGPVDEDVGHAGGGQQRIEQPGPSGLTAELIDEREDRATAGHVMLRAEGSGDGVGCRLGGAGCQPPSDPLEDR
jgi:hypothetical protein